MGNRGKPPIPDFQQARILAKKMSHSDTQQNIALEENVSRSSVIRITPESVSPNVLRMAEDFKAEIVEKAKRNIKDGLDEMHVRMFSSAAKLAEVTGAVKISHDILQLQTGGATQNMGVSVNINAILSQFRRKFPDAGNDVIAEYLRVFGGELGLSGDVIEVECRRLEENNLPQSENSC